MCLLPNDVQVVLLARYVCCPRFTASVKYTMQSHRDRVAHVYSPSQCQPGQVGLQEATVVVASATVVGVIGQGSHKLITPTGV